MGFHKVNKILALLTTVRVLSDSGLRCWSQRWMIKAKVIRDEVKKWIVILFPLQPVLIALLNSVSVKIIQTASFHDALSSSIKGEKIVSSTLLYWKIQDTVGDFLSTPVTLRAGSQNVLVLAIRLCLVVKGRHRQGLEDHYLKRMHFYIGLFPTTDFTQYLGTRNVCSHIHILRVPSCTF